MHHIAETDLPAEADCAAIDAELRRVLGGYNKTNLLAAHYPLKAVAETLARAQRLENASGGGDIPACNTTRVFELWLSIYRKALPSQLPQEFRDVFVE